MQAPEQLPLLLRVPIRAFPGRLRPGLPLQHPILLRTHQQLHLRRRSLLGEQCEKIRLPVHHADHPHPVEGPRHLGAVPKSLDPGYVFSFSAWPPVPLARPIRPQHPQRQPRSLTTSVACRILAPSLPSGCARSPPVLTPAVPREVQIAPVLDAQHRRPLHPLSGPLPVRGQDVGHRHRRGFRLVDQPVVSLTAAESPRATPVNARPGSCAFGAHSPPVGLKRRSPSGAPPNSC